MGVSANEPFVEDSPRKVPEILFFQSPQVACADLRVLGYFFERDAAHLALALHAFAE
jgi:hypothetical protein